MEVIVKRKQPQSDELMHYGVLGMKWGVRRYRNKDGSLTDAGIARQKKRDTRKLRSSDRGVKFEAEVFDDVSNDHEKRKAALNGKQYPTVNDMLKDLNDYKVSALVVEMRRSRYAEATDDYIKQAHDYIANYGSTAYKEFVDKYNPHIPIITLDDK